MKRAFTLIELLIVIIIIGILAIIAVPQYQKMVKRAKGAEALSCFKAIEQAQEAYYLQYGKYVNINPDSMEPAYWDALGLNNLNAEGNFVYDCKTGGAATYFVRILAYHLPDPGNRDYRTSDYDIRYYVRDDGQYKQGELYWDRL